MLGTSRASQYAGWWAQEPSVAITTSSVLADTVYQQPNFSLDVNNTNISWNTVADGNYNLTGYTGLTGFNNARATYFITAYLTWPTVGISTSDFVSMNINNQIVDNSTFVYYNAQVALSNSNTTMYVTPGFPGGFTNLNMPGSYTQYMNRWLTFVWCSSETAASYSSWSNPSGTGNYCRTAVYDTELGTLISKLDYRQTWTAPVYANFPTTCPANTDGSYGMLTNGYGSGTTTEYRYNLGGAWGAFGTMFDPLSSTDTTWLTTRPNATIGTGKAWYNIQLTNYATDGIPKTYVNTSGMDLYSQTNNYMIKNQGYNTTDWTQAYNSTLFPKDSS